MPIRKPVRKSLSRQVLENMESLIRDGEWAVGQRIPSEPELMRLFQVGHNTVREAVQGLVHTGMLCVRPGDGTYVTATDKLDAALTNRLCEEAVPARILEARLAIEQAVVALAARRCTPAELADIEAAWARCGERTGRGIEDDMAFHIAIADAAGNPLLSHIYRVIVDYLRSQFSDLLAERQYDPAALRLHEELLQALRRRDETSARNIVAKIVDFDYSHLPAE